VRLAIANDPCLVTEVPLCRRHIIHLLILQRD
jgi:hypothetical protein